MTRCPVCSTILYRRVVGGVTLDGCPACGGVWMDKGELQTLARDPVGLKMVGGAFPKGLQPPAGARTGSCPRCGGSLSEFEYASFRGVRLDRCKSCEGVWLDCGEAEQIAAQLLASRPTGTAAEPLPTSEILDSSTSPSPSVAARFGPARPAAPSPALAPVAAAAVAPSVADPTSTSQLPLVRGVAVGPFDRTPGFLANIERGMRFIKGAYGLALECPRLLVPMVAGAAIQLALAAIVVAVMIFRSRNGQGEPEFLRDGGLALAAAGVVFAFAAQLGNMAILGMTVSMVDAYLKGLKPDLSVAARDVMKNAGGVAAMAVVSTAVSMLTSRDKHGHRGILASMIDQAWTVLSYLLMPIIMIEDIGLLAALRRAKELHARGVLQIAVGEIGLRAIAGLSAFVVIGFAGLAAFLIFPHGLAGMVAIIAVAVLFLVALGVLHAFARGAYYTCLYLWAIEVERAGDPVRALVPSPLAAALIG